MPSLLNLEEAPTLTHFFKPNAAKPNLASAMSIHLQWHLRNGKHHLTWPLNFELEMFILTLRHGVEKWINRELAGAS